MLSPTLFHHPVASGSAPAPAKTLYRAPSRENLTSGGSGTGLPRIPSNSNLEVVDVRGVASHPWHDVPIGSDAPDVVSCIVEIPAVSHTDGDPSLGHCLVQIWEVFISKGKCGLVYHFRCRCKHLLARKGDALEAAWCRLSFISLCGSTRVC